MRYGGILIVFLIILNSMSLLNGNEIGVVDDGNGV
jgi:hypothetical protein